MDLLLYISDTADFVQNVYRPYIYLFFSTIHDFLIDVISFGCLYSIVCPEKNPGFLYYLTISQFILFRQFFTDVTPTYMISKIFPCQTFEPSMHCTKPRNIFQTYNRHNAIKIPPSISYGKKLPGSATKRLPDDLWGYDRKKCRFVRMCRGF